MIEYPLLDVGSARASSIQHDVLIHVNWKGVPLQLQLSAWCYERLKIDHASSIATSICPENFRPDPKTAPRPLGEAIKGRRSSLKSIRLWFLLLQNNDFYFCKIWKEFECVVFLHIDPRSGQRRWRISGFKFFLGIQTYQTPRDRSPDLLGIGDEERILRIEISGSTKESAPPTLLSSSEKHVWILLERLLAESWNVVSWSRPSDSRRRNVVVLCCISVYCQCQRETTLALDRLWHGS